MLFLGYGCMWVSRVGASMASHTIPFPPPQKKHSEGPTQTLE